MPPEPPQPPDSPQSRRFRSTYLPQRVRKTIARNQHAQTPEGTPQLPTPANDYQAEPPAEPAQPASFQPQPPPTGSPPSPYEFIMNPVQPAQPRFSLPSASLPMRALFIAGGLLVLVIIFAIIKGLFGGGSDFTPYITVAQEQQELIHLATDATKEQQGVSVANQNFASTTQLSMTSSQTALIKYLALNGQKVGSKVLDLKVSTSLDNQLQAAYAAATYDQVFQQIMQTELTAYLSELHQAYEQTAGKNGHALLSSDYDQAQLLLTQLNEPGQ